MANLKILRFNLVRQSCKYRPALPVFDYSLASRLGPTSISTMSTHSHESDVMWPEYVPDGTVPVIRWLWDNVFAEPSFWSFRVQSPRLLGIISAYLDS